MATLFDPIVLGDLELPNRIVMAPLTRCRADEGRVPNALSQCKTNVVCPSTANAGLRRR